MAPAGPVGCGATVSAVLDGAVVAGVFGVEVVPAAAPATAVVPGAVAAALHASSVPCCTAGEPTAGAPAAVEGSGTVRVVGPSAAAVGAVVAAMGGGVVVARGVLGSTLTRIGSAGLVVGIVDGSVAAVSDAVPSVVWEPGRDVPPTGC
ncbi:hypothetical protein [Curtobacterium sp. MCSS17_007]|uniref:hypothetical protein n=1 Tax=Curtobacterium sp. MCSS17_007 TaxID=2175646 RepID=UPI0015E8D07E|nr:hypothetical protein [Curtobacterium sp. MCSS17_007]WIE77039.1 hypothetical protein DEJ22_007230 [Curtobacterium sp. MCSS17_007]